LKIELTNIRIRKKSARIYVRYLLIFRTERRKGGNKKERMKEGRREGRKKEKSRKDEGKEGIQERRNS